MAANSMNTYGNLTRGILLIAGTSIGGGMLALPVLTSQVGFFPSLIIYLLSWFFMMCTGLLFLEISLWMGKDVNIISMAEHTLGKWGKIAAWCLYLFLFYCLILAYIVGAGNLVAEVMAGSINLKEWQAQLLFLLMFAPFVYAGARLVSRVNIFLMLGLAISYLCFVYLGYSHVKTDFLLSADWSKAWTAVPITFTAFAYQGTIPTLIEYLKRDVRQVRLAIILGSFLPLITYAIWQWLILGIVPIEGPHSLTEAIQKGQNAIQPLKNILKISPLYLVGQYFVFFALLTSFFGVTLGLLDFWVDGLKIKKTPTTKFYLCLLIFLPPLLFALVHPHVFLMALDYAGGFGCALLLGLLPVLMVWSGRYQMGMRGEYRVFGGRLLLVGLIAFVLIELACQLALIT